MEAPKDLPNAYIPHLRFAIATESKKTTPSSYLTKKLLAMCLLDRPVSEARV